MKERSLLYFITALIASILLLMSIVIRTQLWFASYGSDAIPSIHKLLIPVALLWVGWYFGNKGFLLAATIIITVLFSFQLDFAGLLNDSFLPILQAPAIKTTFVLGFILMLANIGFGYFTYFKLKKH
ncbi:MAG: hypothetical protein IH571_06155 [Acholeplasmataceae bacterium]|nr:hypothetical protein [Acholeplasmataceae bacterium]